MSRYLKLLYYGHNRLSLSMVARHNPIAIGFITNNTSNLITDHPSDTCHFVIVWLKNHYFSNLNRPYISNNFFFSFYLEVSKVLSWWHIWHDVNMSCQRCVYPIKSVAWWSPPFPCKTWQNNMSVAFGRGRRQRVLCDLPRVQPKAHWWLALDAPLDSSPTQSKKSG